MRSSTTPTRHHPCIVAMWHGEFMLLPLIKPANKPTDIMLARHSDAEFLGEALKRFDMQLIRGAGAAGRNKDRGGAHAYRSAIQALRDGRAVAMTADVPGGHARKAGLGIVMAAKQSGRAILPVAIATRRYLALNTWSRMKINLPHSSLGFAVGPLVRVPREATPEELEVYRQEVEDSLNLATQQAYDRAGGDLSRAVPGGAGAKSTKPGLWLKTYRAATSYARPIAPVLLGLRERRGKEEPSRRHERLGQPRLKRPAGRLAWFHAASVGETNAVLPVMAALAQGAPDAVVPAHHRHGHVGEARRPAARSACHASVRAAGCAGVRVELSRSLASRPGGVHRIGDLAQPDPGERGARHPAGARECPHDEALVPPVAAQSGLRASPVQPLRPGAGAERGAGTALRHARRAECRSPPATSRSTRRPPLVDEAELDRLRPALQGRPLLFAANTHAGEDEIVAEAHRLLAAGLPGLCTIIAPRHPHRGGAIAEMLRARGFKVAQRSLRPAARPHQRCLRRRYHRRARHALQAGAGGLHRRLVGRPRRPQSRRGDAARRRGAHRSALAKLRMRPIASLLQQRGAIVVQSAEEIAAAVRTLLSDAAELDSMRSRADAALATISGALPRTIEALLRYLPGEEGLARAS